MAVSAWLVYLDSFLWQKTLVAADGRSTTTNNSEKRATLTGHWQNVRGLLSMTFVSCIHALLMSYS